MRQLPLVLVLAALAATVLGCSGAETRRASRVSVLVAKAAVVGVCLALVAYNVVAVVMAALRSVPGAETIDQELSLYYVTNDIARGPRPGRRAGDADRVP